MCGIFGILAGRGASFPEELLRESAGSLFRLSESRGKEASGLLVRANQALYVLKEAVSASQLMNSAAYRSLFTGHLRESGYTDSDLAVPFAFVGHSRLVTNGRSELNWNNQPVVKDGAAGVHNGIVVNDRELWEQFPELRKKTDLDTEILLSLLQLHRRQSLSLRKAVADTFSRIKGSASVALLFDDLDAALLATNTGSLYTCTSDDGKVLIFASEKYFLRELLAGRALKARFSQANIAQIRAGTGCLVSLRDLSRLNFGLFAGPREDFPEEELRDLALPEKVPVRDLSEYRNPPPVDVSRYRLREEVQREMLETWERLYSGELGIRRCTRCLNTEHMPFIQFDAEGVCNYCRSYEARKRQGHRTFKGEEKLRELVSRHRSEAGKPDCVVGFSGGRDSGYGLYYIIKHLGLHPIVFTYDWGMVVDLARRNQARITGKLGIEQILVSADIRRKRENVRKNFEAWLKRPRLGMLPILMAGDKKFYYYFHKIREQNDLNLFIFCGGHEAEETPFKYGFCGVSHGIDDTFNRLTGISWVKKLTLISYYAANFLLNPAYLNRSVLDTLDAFYSTYVLHDDYLYLYHYLEWDERQVVDTISREFEWETAPDTVATWRIDDGTAPVYNYIYLALAGFTEFDDFRSFQIREGKLTREEAFQLVKEENKPRFEEIEWYAEAIDLDVNRAIGIVNQAAKLYERNLREAAATKAAARQAPVITR